MQLKNKPPIGERWAHLRFSVVGALLASPPRPGELKAALRALADRHWIHPATGESTRFAMPTIERWFYTARLDNLDPVAVLRKKERCDRGQHPSIPMEMRAFLQAQHKVHSSWSYQLHYDNLAAAIATGLLPRDTPLPSYASVRRYMKGNRLLRERWSRRLRPPGDAPLASTVVPREVRSYEAEYVNGLWHSDFHLGSLRVITPAGQWVRPYVLCFLDDRSRLVCHVQWYLNETAQVFVHGLAQAIQKRSRPGALLTDNGSAMIAVETEQGLLRLGVVHDTTLPYHPEQNGKQEKFWDQLEGRLLSMLENHPALTLDILNQATQAWSELEYNNKLHSEIGSTPMARHLAGPDVGRISPDSDALRLAFTCEETRTQRRSDGTLTLNGKRFEVPSRLRHLIRVTVRFARWDLSRVFVVDPNSHKVIDRLYPLDRQANADGRRRRLAEPKTIEDTSAKNPSGDVAPLLKKLMADYAATGLPPSYLSFDKPDSEEDK